MDLSTTYLGLDLPHPFMPGASPLVDDLDTVKRLEDAGAAAIVMHSLFEEQIRREQLATFLHTELHGESYAEALYYFPRPDAFQLGPEEYLEQLARIKGTEIGRASCRERVESGQGGEQQETRAAERS